MRAVNDFDCDLASHDLACSGRFTDGLAVDESYLWIPEDDPCAPAPAYVPDPDEVIACGRTFRECLEWLAAHGYRTLHRPRYYQQAWVNGSCRDTVHELAAETPRSERPCYFVVEAPSLLGHTCAFVVPFDIDRWPALGMSSRQDYSGPAYVAVGLTSAAYKDFAQLEERYPRFPERLQLRPAMATDAWAEAAGKWVNYADPGSEPSDGDGEELYQWLSGYREPGLLRDGCELYAWAADADPCLPSLPAPLSERDLSLWWDPAGRYVRGIGPPPCCWAGRAWRGLGRAMDAVEAAIGEGDQSGAPRDMLVGVLR
jgi:hypothetical protein